MHTKNILPGIIVFFSLLTSCSSAEQEKKEESIPEVKQEQVDSLLDNASKMIESTSDSLNKAAEEKK